MIDGILPDGIVGIDLFGDIAPALIFQEEVDQIRKAVPKRQREYMSVRHCARLALAQIGFKPTPLPRGNGGTPVWPEGSVGSMTHCLGYRAAAVARENDLASIGIDAEQNKQLPSEILSFIASPYERGLLRELDTFQLSVQWDTLLFCAKEAVFKAWYPIMERWLGFEDVRISIQLAEPSSTLSFTGTFFICPVVDSGDKHVTAISLLDAMAGQWQCVEGIITTSVAVSAHEWSARQMAQKNGERKKAGS